MVGRLLAALVRWCVPTASLSIGVGRMRHITHGYPTSHRPTIDVDGDDLRGWPGPDGGVDL